MGLITLLSSIIESNKSLSPLVQFGNRLILLTTSHSSLPETVVDARQSMADSAGENSKPFHPSLTRALIQSNLAAAKEQQSNKRMTNEAVIASGEVLRLFVHEARHRAGIEAECEQEGTLNDESGKLVSSTVPVRADHITKIAAELLMDFT